MTTKKCSRCHLEVDIAGFNRGSHGGFHSYCKPCLRSYKNEWNKNNPGKARATADAWDAKNLGRRAWLKRRLELKKYGLTPEDYDRILLEQSGKCAVCRSDDPDGRGTFHIDHCHKSGKFRGLLCHGCNTGTKLTDNLDLLAKKIVYLTKHINNEIL